MSSLDYLIRFAQTHDSFRLPEIEALRNRLNSHPSVTSRHLNIHVQQIFYSPASPFCIIRFNVASPPHPITPSTPSYSPPPPLSQEELSTLASLFISPSIQSRFILELWGHGSTYTALHADIVRRSSHIWPAHQSRDASFKFSIDSFLGKRTEAEKKGIIDGFAYLGFKGDVRMKGAVGEWWVCEEWEGQGGVGGEVEVGSKGHGGGEGEQAVVGSEKRLKHVYLGRKVGESRRGLVEKHDLKKRPYISTTSMDAELALVTANLALAGEGKLFLDPFCGTGGFMVAAAELGAIVIGSDIDGRSFRGKSKGVEKGVGANFRKYGLEGRFGDCFTADLVNTPVQARRRWLDGMICDPPYGVREGLKVLGARSGLQLNGSDEASRPQVSKVPPMIDGAPAHTQPDYVAPKRPYSFTRMLSNILDFAAKSLVDGGRLAFWMPSANEDELGQDQVTEVPTHHLMMLRHECVQRFNHWSRRLLVYERRSGDTQGLLDSQPALFQWQQQGIDHGVRADELNPFRKRYFEGFNNSSTG